jgi:predicted secreted hydrolase
MQWKIRVPSLGIDLEATTKLPSQELSDNSKIVPSYWEGAIILTTAKSLAVRGSGYLEMAGYDRKLNMP